jgi:urease accessory protein UreF
VPADPVKLEQAAAAWDMAITAQAYGATNSTKLANLYVMEQWANAATNEAQRDGILRDASRMAEIENNLTRNLGDWRVALTPGYGQAQTNIVAETKWVPVQ